MEIEHLPEARTKNKGVIILGPENKNAVFSGIFLYCLFFIIFCSSLFNYDTVLCYLLYEIYFLYQIYEISYRLDMEMGVDLSLPLCTVSQMDTSCY